MSFDLGQLVTTAQVNADMRDNFDFNNDVTKALYRYMSCDFSDMEHEKDIQANLDAIESGESRIFASYKTTLGDIWIITECDRSVTKVLYPSEY